MSDHEVHEEGLTRREALKKGAILGGVAMAWTTPAVQIVGMSPALAATTSPVGQGCTPGYWRNSPGAWVATGLLPTEMFSGYFALGVCADDVSLGDAVNYGGSDMAQKLIRAAVAALLNARHPDVYYGMGGSNIIAEVNTALAGCDHDAMETLKNKLDMYNNAGCPLRNMRG